MALIGIKIGIHRSDSSQKHYEILANIVITFDGTGAVP